MVTGPRTLTFTPLVVGLPRMIVPSLPPPLLFKESTPPTKLTSPVVAKVPPDVPSGTDLPFSTGPPPSAKGLFTVRPPWLRVTPPVKVLLPAFVKLTFCAPSVSVAEPDLLRETTPLPSAMSPANGAAVVPLMTNVPAVVLKFVIMPPAALAELVRAANVLARPLRSKVPVSLRTSVVDWDASEPVEPRFTVPCWMTRLL